MDVTIENEPKNCPNCNKNELMEDVDFSGESVSFACYSCGWVGVAEIETAEIWLLKIRTHEAGEEVDPETFTRNGMEPGPLLPGFEQWKFAS